VKGEFYLIKEKLENKPTMPTAEDGDIKTLEELDSLSILSLLDHYNRLQDSKCGLCTSVIKDDTGSVNKSSYSSKYKYCLSGCTFGEQFILIGESYESSARKIEKRLDVSKRKGR
jgi:hypothetical protein